VIIQRPGLHISLLHKYNYTSAIDRSLFATGHYKHFPRLSQHFPVLSPARVGIGTDAFSTVYRRSSEEARVAAASLR